MSKIIKGDLIELAKNGEFDLIIHGCNCFCTMGKGIAPQIKAAFPEAYEADLKTVKGDRSKLGTYSWAYNREYNLIVVNAYTQYDYRPTYKNDGQRRVDYDALTKVFTDIKYDFDAVKIGYPKIGAGLAGGDWGIISSIIDTALIGENHTLVEYEKN